MNDFKVGQSVTYTFYGVAEVATITRIGKSGTVLFLDNGRWMFTENCKAI